MFADLTAPRGSFASPPARLCCSAFCLNISLTSLLTPCVKPAELVDSTSRCTSSVAGGGSAPRRLMLSFVPISALCGGRAFAGFWKLVFQSAGDDDMGSEPDEAEFDGDSGWDDMGSPERWPEDG